MYFALKDAEAVLACAIWKSRAGVVERPLLKEGERVVCHGALDVYKPRGSYSLIVSRIERRGLGELLARLEELKRELAAAGWFARSRVLPRLPRVVGVVTSRDGAALQDFLRSRSLRWPLYPVRLAHSPVQGAEAAACLAQAIRRLDASGVDVIVVTRGGGSLEDLWCFNEREVAEAIFGASVPVVSGVGHEIDVTLADHVADHRAHTPTDAAQMVIPERRALLAELERAESWLAGAVDGVLARREERLAALARSRVLLSPSGFLDGRRAAAEALGRRLALSAAGVLASAEARLAESRHRLARQSPRLRVERACHALAAFVPRLARGLDRRLSRRAERLELAARSLEATSPFAVLRRGYSITRRVGDGRAVRAADELAAGEAIETRLASGSVRSVVSEDGAGARNEEPE